MCDNFSGMYTCVLLHSANNCYTWNLLNNNPFESLQCPFFLIWYGIVNFLLKQHNFLDLTLIAWLNCSVIFYRKYRVTNILFFFRILGGGCNNSLPGITKSYFFLNIDSFLLYFSLWFAFD